MASGQLGNVLQDSSKYGIEGNYTKDNDILDNKGEIEIKSESNNMLNGTGMHLAVSQNAMEERDRGSEDSMNNEDRDAFYLPEHFLYSNGGLGVASTSDQSENTQMNADSDDHDDHEDSDSMDYDDRDTLTLEDFRNSKGSLGVMGASSQTPYTRRNMVLGEPLSCEECTLKFQYKRDYTRHMLIHTGEKPFICNQCGEGFVRDCHLKWHMKLHTGEESYPCTVCKKVFARKQYQQQHMLLHSDITERPYQCHLCENGYVKKSHLDRHIKAHLNIHDFNCSICGDTFIEKRRLVSHMDRLHSGKRPFPCPVCKQEFRKQYILDKHMLKHPDANIDTLENSNGAYKKEVSQQKGSLETPIDEDFLSTEDGMLENPTEEEPSTPGGNTFVCSVCKKSFVKIQYLQQHMLLHMDKSERPYQCHLCDHGYVKKSHLDRHLISHTVVKNSFCSICGKGFLDKMRLARHIRRIHKVKRPYQSSVYNQDSRKEHILQTHRLSHTNSSTEGTKSHSLPGNMISQNALLGKINNDKESLSSDTFENSMDEYLTHQLNLLTKQ